MKTSDTHIRQLVFFLVLTTIVMNVVSQNNVTLPGGDTEQNYITSAIMTQPLSSGAVSYQNAIIRTDYLDGLGRPQQTVSWRAAGYKDLADFTQYNERGKPCRSWLPTVSSSADGSFIPLDDLENLYSARYPDASVFYSTSVYDSTPAAELAETRAPGAWQGHDGVRTQRLVSDETGMLAAKRFTVNSDGALVKSGSYVSGQLIVTKVTDEDGKVALDFVDKDGHTVLKRSVLGGAVYADTYLVHDIYGNLCYVLPPMASFHIQSMSDGTISDTNDWLLKYAYHYKWDHRNRMTEKRLPGCDPVYMVYDKCDQLVYSQDGNQRLGDKWTLTAYDALGRVAYTAQVPDNRTSEQLSQSIAAVSPRVSLSAAGTVFGYSGIGNVTENSILSVNYYDGYDFLSTFAETGDSLTYRVMNGYDEKYVADAPQLSARGLLTGTVTRVLGDTTLLVRSLYYDHHGNVIQSHETNALGGAEHTYSCLSFTGKPLQVMHVHATADTTMTDVYSYTYDNMERLLTASVSHDGGTAVQLVQNTYNQLGQLYRQYLGMGIDGITFYSYNVRGWTTLVNNSNFRQTLHYQDTYGNATPCFNGNISAMEWREKDAMMASTPTQHHYLFTYDGLNRLNAADYGATDGQEWNGSLVINGDNPVRDYDCTYGYDLNGNLTSLTRKGVRVALAPFDYTYWTYGTIDDLSLTYNGNQLKNATDQSTNVYPYEGLMDFKDGANERVEYAWDANGNMTMDANKGITRIKYNVLNLPQEITYSDRHIVRYKYAADGRKLQTEYLMSMVPIIIRGEDAEASSDSDSDLFGDMGLRDPIGGGITPIDSLFIPAETTLMVRDYCGSHIYRDNTLERINNDYGYCANGNWYYYIKDYQGNVRAVINDAGTLKEVNNYYPYSALMGGGTVGNNQSVQPYKYGTKELDRQNGLDWYDSQARMYDPLLGRTPTMDPKAEDYAPISPYAWCAGNPILATDPTGEEWIISSSVDKNGGVSVNIKITGVVYNNSTEDIDMYAFCKAVVSQIEDVFTFSDDVERFEVKTKADIRVVNSVDDISEKDHVFQIVNQSSLDLGTLAETNGLNIIVGSTTAKETIAGTNTRTISHELGHSGGLKDTNKSNVDKVKLKTNLMTQISALQSLRVPNPKHVVGLTPTQIRRIIQNKESSNQKSAIRYQNTYMQSGHLHPMFGFPFLNKTRRKVLK